MISPEGEESSCKQVVREYVRAGRHDGICTVLITQSPVDIDRRIVKQCNTRLIFSLEPDQLIAIQGVKADASQNMIDNLPKAKQGTCILSGTYETVKHAIPVAIRSMNTPNADAGASPDIFTEVNNSKTKEVKKND